MQPAPLPAWRVARPEDLDAIHALSVRLHPGHPERCEVFAERLALAPAFCAVLENDRELAGYCIAHPWSGPAPALDTLLGALPAPATTLYLHDIAIDPAMRGRGAPQAALAFLEAAAPASLHAIGLTALAGTAGLWRRLGFREVAVAPGSSEAAALASYGAGALKMVRDRATAPPGMTHQNQ